MEQWKYAIAILFSLPGEMERAQVLDADWLFGYSVLCHSYQNFTFIKRWEYGGLLTP